MSFSTVPNYDIESLAAMKTIASGLPFIAGTWFFVDPTSGSASNDGLTPFTAFASIATAYTACTDGAGDGIVVMSRGTTTAATTSYLLTSITWSKHGITVFGVASENGIFSRARVANTTTVQTLAALITVSGNNNRFQNIMFWNGGTDATAVGGIIVIGARNKFVNCHIVGGAGATPTANERSLELGSGAQENGFVNCVFGTDTVDRGNNANCELYINSTTADGRNYFHNCEFLANAETGTAHLAIKSAGATSLGRHMILRDCTFLCYVSNLGADMASVFGGTAFNTAKLFILGSSAACGYAAWDSSGSNNVVYVAMPATAASGGGGIPTTP